MLARKVWIKKGAYLVIDQTEAMVTIDVNTGRFVGERDQEQHDFRDQPQAAREIARQIRLRDIGGLIVCDFIDMYNRENRRKLYEEFKKAFSHDRAKRAINPVTDFGLIEMTRERVRPSHMHDPVRALPDLRRPGTGTVEGNAGDQDRALVSPGARGRKFRDFHLVVSPDLAEVMARKRLNRI